MAYLLARRLALKAPASARCFSASTSHAARIPSLSDVSHDNVSTFDQKQQAFREELASKHAKGDSAASSQKQASSSAGSSASHSAPDIVSSATRDLADSASSAATEALRRAEKASGEDSPGKALGSLSPTITGDAKEANSAQMSSAGSGDKDSKKRGPLSSLLYGTEEGQQLDRDIERSFSQVLARGKYVHSIVFHEVKPDKVDEYTQLVGDWYPKVAGDATNKVHLVGSWRTEVGDCDTFVHIWEYQVYSGYHESQNRIQHHPEFPAFDKKLKTLINSKRTSLMQEFSFWPTTAPRRLGGVFELRSYTLHPGNLLEWESHWRKGLQARREVMEGVGAWFVQIGELNTVHHLWQFADLEERRRRRELSWAVQGWSDTVHSTVPLIQSMRSRILVPCEWSPVG